jgi:hypothetical protein
MFEDMGRLRTLRLSDNNLICDCHLSWLARWLRRAPRLGLYTRCFSPNQLKGQNVADLHDQEFKCSGKGILADTRNVDSHHNYRFVSTAQLSTCIDTAVFDFIVGDPFMFVHIFQVASSAFSEENEMFAL